MSTIPENLRYTKDHEWAKAEGGLVITGITDYAQHELGDIVYVELPETGLAITKGNPYGEIEAVKTVAPLNAPVSGTITEVNKKLSDNAGAINADPYGDGWIIKIKISDKSELDSLLNAAAYKDLIA